VTGTPETTINEGLKNSGTPFISLLFMLNFTGLYFTYNLVEEHREEMKKEQAIINERIEKNIHNLYAFDRNIGTKTGPLNLYLEKMNSEIQKNSELITSNRESIIILKVKTGNE